MSFADLILEELEQRVQEMNTAAEASSIKFQEAQDLFDETSNELTACNREATRAPVSLEFGKARLEQRYREFPVKPVHVNLNYEGVTDPDQLREIVLELERDLRHVKQTLKDITDTQKLEWEVHDLQRNATNAPIVLQSAQAEWHEAYDEFHAVAKADIQLVRQTAELNALITAKKARHE